MTKLVQLHSIEISISYCYSKAIQTRLFPLFIAFSILPLSYASDITQSIGPFSIQVVTLEQNGVPPGIEFRPEPVQVEIQQYDDLVYDVGTFRGVNRKTNRGTVVYTIGSKTFNSPISPDGSFTVKLPLNVREHRVRFISVAHSGNVHEDIALVRAISAEQPARRFAIDVGAGVSHLNYKEVAGTRISEVKEFGLTAKSGINYSLSRQFELGGNAFITTATIPAGTENQARWYGVNGRLGYKLPFRPGVGSYHFMVGYYIWGMLVPSDANYGVQSLGGPQFFLTGRFQTLSRRKYYAYLKFASIQDSGLISLTNRELAIGVGYQLNETSANGRRWMGTIDIASAQFAKTSQSFELLSTTLGLSTHF